MPGISKATKKKKESSAQIADRFVNELDLNMVMAGVLGGLAAYGGIVPPFTRLLMTFSSMTGGALSSDAIKMDYMDKIKLGASAMSPGFILGGGAGTLMGIVLKNYLVQGGTNEQIAEKQAAAISSTALFSSGALEAMLMYKAFSNPEVAKALISAPAEIIKGVGSIVPG